MLLRRQKRINSRDIFSLTDTELGVSQGVVEMFDKFRVTVAARCLPNEPETILGEEMSSHLGAKVTRNVIIGYVDL